MIIMTSSLIVGKSADITRAYYSVIVALLICGAFLLAECGIALDPYNGIDERWVLLVTAFFIGPLQVCLRFIMLSVKDMIQWKNLGL